MVKGNVSKKDQELIDIANQCDCTEWYIVSDKMSQTKSDDVKNTLKRISLRLYRTEEGQNGDS